jgi:hypothetical protein
VYPISIDHREPVGEPASAPLAAHRIARLGALDAASLCHVRLRRRLFLPRDAGGLRRGLRLKRDGPAYDWNGPHPVQPMVRDGRLIRLRSGAHGRALSCRRLHDKAVTATPQQMAATTTAKRGSRWMLNGSRSSVIAWEADRPCESAFRWRAHFRFGEPVISVATDWAFWGHVSDSSARVGRSSHSTQNRRKLPYFPQFVRAIDHAMVADQFLGEVGRRMPVNERVRSASRFNATMRAAILILAD